MSVNGVGGRNPYLDAVKVSNNNTGESFGAFKGHNNGWDVGGFQYKTGKNGETDLLKGLQGGKNIQELAKGGNNDKPGEAGAGKDAQGGKDGQGGNPFGDFMKDFFGKDSPFGKMMDQLFGGGGDQNKALGDQGAGGNPAGGEKGGAAPEGGAPGGGGKPGGDNPFASLFSSPSSGSSSTTPSADGGSNKSTTPSSSSGGSTSSTTKPKETVTTTTKK